MQIMSFVGGLLCASIADRLTSSRGMLMAWWTIGALCVSALAMVNLHVSNLLLVGAAGFFCLGAQHMLNNFTARAYETNLRATGVGMELGVGRIGGILGPFIVGGLQQLHSGTTTSFLAIGAAVLAAAISLGLGAEVRRGAPAPAVV
jgi:hypothetical protein